MTALLDGPQAPSLLATAEVLPRINLIPAQVIEARRFRRLQQGMAGAVVAAVLLVGVGFAVLSAETGTAQSQLTASQADVGRLQTRVGGYQSVRTTYQEVAADRAALRQALGQEVLFSQFLANLSASVPASIEITSLTVTVGGSAGSAPSGLSGAAGSTTPLPSGVIASGGSPGTPIGTISISGLAGSQNDVASWLDAIDGQQGVRDPYLSTSSQSQSSTPTVVKFDSTAVLTSAALSGRYSGANGGLK